jgi:hypothetical protein
MDYPESDESRRCKRNFSIVDCTPISEIQTPVTVVFALPTSTGDTCIIDTGATQCICYDRNYFLSMKQT